MRYMSVVDLTATIIGRGSISVIPILTFCLTSILTYCSHIRPICGNREWTCCCHLPLTPLEYAYLKIPVKLQQDNLKFIDNHTVPQRTEFYLFQVYVMCQLSQTSPSRHSVIMTFSFIYQLLEEDTSKIRAGSVHSTANTTGTVTSCSDLLCIFYLIYIPP
jgi:hypothetical protein